MKAMNKCEIKFSNLSDKMQSELILRILHHWLMLSASVLSLCTIMCNHHTRKPCRALVEKPLILQMAWEAIFVKAHMLQKQCIQNPHRESEIRCTICSKVHLAVWLCSTCLYRKPKSSESKPTISSKYPPEQSRHHWQQTWHWLIQTQHKKEKLGRRCFKKGRAGKLKELMHPYNNCHLDPYSRRESVEP